MTDRGLIIAAIIVGACLLISGILQSGAQICAAHKLAWRSGSGMACEQMRGDGPGRGGDREGRGEEGEDEDGGGWERGGRSERGGRGR